MARPGLTKHRKFLRLARVLKSPILARGVLELLWEPAYESGDDYIGDAIDVEAVTMWTGRPGALVEALLTAGGDGRPGFIDEIEDRPGHYRIHDLYDHAPDYVERRVRRELQRNAKGQTISSLRSAAGRRGAEQRWQTDGKRMASGQQVDNNGVAKVATPAPAPAPTPAPARAPRLPSNGAREWTPNTLWDAWRLEAQNAGAPQPAIAGPSLYTHLEQLVADYPEASLRAALRCWWASPHTGGRNLGLFRSQVGEVLEHLSRTPDAVFRAPPPARVSVAPAPSGYEWECPHTPRCGSRFGCLRQQQISALHPGEAS